MMMIIKPFIESAAIRQCNAPILFKLSKSNVNVTLPKMAFLSEYGSFAEIARESMKIIRRKEDYKPL
jgi:hypothetical protein